MGEWRRNVQLSPSDPHHKQYRNLLDKIRWLEFGAGYSTLHDEFYRDLCTHDDGKLFANAE